MQRVICHVHFNHQRNSNNDLRLTRAADVAPSLYVAFFKGPPANEQQFASSSEDDLASTQTPARPMTMACGRRRTFSHTRPTTAKHAVHARHEFLQSRSGCGRTRVSRKSRTSTRKKGRGKQKPSPRLRQDLTKRSAKSPRSLLGSSCEEKNEEGGANKEVDNRRFVQLCLEETNPSIRETL
jgi:hypothetical protein